jgi:hypothetical protein
VDHVGCGHAGPRDREAHMGVQGFDHLALTVDDVERSVDL